MNVCVCVCVCVWERERERERNIEEWLVNGTMKTVLLRWNALSCNIEIIICDFSLWEFLQINFIQ